MAELDGLMSIDQQMKMKQVPVVDETIEPLDTTFGMVVELCADW